MPPSEFFSFKKSWKWKAKVEGVDNEKVAEGKMVLRKSPSVSSDI